MRSTRLPLRQVVPDCISKRSPQEQAQRAEREYGEDRPVFKIPFLRNRETRLTEEQFLVVQNMAIFFNLTENQIQSLYSHKQDYFQSDIQKLMRLKILDREPFTIKDKKIWLYHLKEKGNTIANALMNQKSRSISKRYIKNKNELLHDLLYYEAAKHIQKKIQENQGKIQEIRVDRKKRSQIYTQNFKDIGKENKQKICDMEIVFTDKSGLERVYEIEIDRGYDAQVIRQKSLSHPYLIWATDSVKQAQKIARHAKSYRDIVIL